MNGFAKDILILDFESTGLDARFAEPTQLGAVLLDKTSLKEKDQFMSYIEADLSKASEEALRVSGITQQDLEGAPNQKQVITEFLEKFGTEVFTASWNSILDRGLLNKMLWTIEKDIFIYDYHYLDVWPIVYTHLCRHGQGDTVRLEPTLKYFGLKPRGNHDALEDCRVTAEVLRKVYFAKD